MLVSHDPRTVLAFCNRALLLDGGAIVMDGPAAGVTERYLSLLTHANPGAA